MNLFLTCAGKNPVFHRFILVYFSALQVNLLFTKPAHDAVIKTSERSIDVETTFQNALCV